MDGATALVRGIRTAVVDSGPLYAVTDVDDADHRACLDVLERPDLRLVIPALVVTEVAWLVGRRLGARAEAAFVKGLAELEVAAPEQADWSRIADLVEKYRDFPLGAVDASVVALAERLDTDLVVTLDRRHFEAVRPRHRHAFAILPDSG